MAYKKTATGVSAAIRQMAAAGATQAAIAKALKVSLSTVKRAMKAPVAASKAVEPATEALTIPPTLPSGDLQLDVSRLDETIEFLRVRLQTELDGGKLAQLAKAHSDAVSKRAHLLGSAKPQAKAPEKPQDDGPGITVVEIIRGPTR